MKKSDIISGNMTLSKVGAYGQNQQGFIKDLKGETAIKKNPLCSASLFTPKEPQKFTVESLGGKDPETLRVQTKEALNVDDPRYRPYFNDENTRANITANSLKIAILAKYLINEYSKIANSFDTEEGQRNKVNKVLGSLSAFAGKDVSGVENLARGIVSRLPPKPSADELEKAEKLLTDELSSVFGMPIKPINGRGGIVYRAPPVGGGAGLESIIGGVSAPIREAGLVPDSFETSSGIQSEFMDESFAELFEDIESMPSQSAPSAPPQPEPFADLFESALARDLIGDRREFLRRGGESEYKESESEAGDF